MTVVGAVDAQGVVKSPGLSSEKKKKKTESQEKKSSAKHKTAEGKPSKSPPQAHKSAADSRIDELDLKWSERFNRLEALLIAKTLDNQEPTFAPVKITPTHTPPVGVVKSSEPFIRPAEKLPTSDLSSTDHSPQRQATEFHLLSRNLQICRVSLRLAPRFNRPANCLRTKQTPTNFQIYLGPAHPFFRPPVNRPQHRPANMTQLPWTLIPNLSFPTDPQWISL